MSNNKQSMKLYTEEQVNRLKYWKNNAEEDYLTTPISVLKYISELEKLAPIELPSDKNIIHLQWIYDRMSNVHDENENYDYMLKFKEIIEQLKKVGNNEQQ